MRILFISVWCIFVIALVACSQTKTNATEMKHFPIDNLDAIISKSDIQLDKEISSDGNGSLRITVTKPTVVLLYEVKDIDIENARLIYQARVRTENIEGQAYLEMWCHFPGKVRSAEWVTPSTRALPGTRVRLLFPLARNGRAKMPGS